MCQTCKETKHVSCFSPLELKHWLAGERKQHTWSCYDCQFPPCCMCEGDQRPLDAVPHNARIDGKYYCKTHRYPPCQGCGQERPEGSLGGTTRRDALFKPWTCPGCMQKDIFCNGACQKELPQHHFLDAMLSDRRAKGDMRSAKCVRRVVQDKHVPRLAEACA